MTGLGANPQRVQVSRYSRMASFSLLPNSFNNSSRVCGSMVNLFSAC